MAADAPRLHPHLFDPNAATSQPFTSPRPGRGDSLSLQQRNRAQHAKRLLDKLEAIDHVSNQQVDDAKAIGVDAGHGIYLQFESEPGFDLKFESLAGC
jgi:hypothetical protein